MRKKKTHEKLRLIREAEGLGRGDFSKITGVSKRTIESIENKGTDPRASYLSEVCSVFPEYALWLMLNEINIEIGQVSPKIKAIWNDYTLDKYERDEFETYGISTKEWNQLDKEHSDGVVTKLVFDRFNVVHRAILINIKKDYDEQVNDAEDTSGLFE